MANEIKIFENEEFGQIRIVQIGGEPYFVGKDIAEILGYSNTKDALLRHVDDEDKQILQRSDFTTLENSIPKSALPVNFVYADVPTRGLTIINESGLYILIFSSKLSVAKKFKHWVTSEVLPTICKTGSYSITTDYNSERIDSLQSEVAKLKEKVSKLPKPARNTHWFSKMYPKYRLLTEYYEISLGRLYYNILLEMQNQFSVDVQQVRDEYLFETGRETCYPIEPFENNKKYREMIESIVNNDLVIKDIVDKDDILASDKIQTIFNSTSID